MFFVMWVVSGLGISSGYHRTWMIAHAYPNVVHYAPDLVREPYMVSVSRRYYLWSGKGAARAGCRLRLGRSGCGSGGNAQRTKAGHILYSLNPLGRSHGSSGYGCSEGASM